MTNEARYFLHLFDIFFAVDWMITKAPVCPDIHPIIGGVKKRWINAFSMDIGAKPNPVAFPRFEFELADPSNRKY